MEVINLILVLIIGLVIGSFLNVCIYRIPKEESIIFPTSNCTNCKEKIKAYDLIPIISYLLLKGKCRNCNMKISCIYPITEAITGVLFLALYINFGFTIQMYLYSFLVFILITSSLIDIRTNYVYFLISILGFLGGAVFVIYNYLNGNSALGYILGGLVAGGIIAIFALLGIMGWGDVEISFICGLFLGINLSILMNILAVVLGGIIGSVILILNKKEGKEIKTMPFVPFISIGCFIALIFGEGFIASFLNYYGLY